MGFLLVLTALPGWQRLIAATVRFVVFGFDELWKEEAVWGADWLWYLPVIVAVWVVLLGPKRICDGL